ncbi:Serine/threonineprotein phosphatase 4 regulatory subunit 2like, partial [Caligus rogercresseyi]
MSALLDNMEEVQMELNSFEKKSTREDAAAEIPPILDDYLVFIARTGNTHFPWMKIKPLFRSKLEQVISEFSQKSEEIPPTPNVDPFQFDAVRDSVLEQLDVFGESPSQFRGSHYKRTDKFMRALEKNMLVVSTIEAVVDPPPLAPPPLGGPNNGLSSFSSTLEQRERDAHLLNGGMSEEEEEEQEEDESTKEEEEESLASHEVCQYSPPQSNGSSQSQDHMNGGTNTDLEAS